MYSMLRAKAGGLEKDLVSFVQELVRTPSLSYDESRAAGVVERRMQEVGFDKVFRDDAGNVVGIIVGLEGDQTVLLNGHLDTVPPNTQGEWVHGAYSGDTLDGAVHGLGAADCKGGVAAQVYAGALLKRSLLPLKGNVVVAATVAEANGRSLGVRALMDKTLPDLGLRPMCAILGEPTDLGLYYGHDGWLEIEVRVTGANAFHVDDAAGAIYQELSAGNGTSGSNGIEAVSVHQPRSSDAVGLRTATIDLARRLGQAEKSGDVLDHIQHEATLLARPMGEVAVDVGVKRETKRLYTGKTTVVHNVTNAWSTDPFDPAMERARQALTAAGMETRPSRWELGRLGMGTAGSVLVGEFGVPTIGFGPGLETQAHAAGEHVKIASLVDAVYGTAAIAHSLVGIPVFGWTADEI